ncbi:MAG: hypothetical protein ACK4M9_19355 [Anaerobacillus sp.]|uniref:hypothetical protein n=1 Tax=Anaerobacillus sp. TaxID=1872506 RepID=UPI00391C6AD1
MSKTNAIIFGSLILATIFAIFGQGVAYFLNENLAEKHPIYYLTVLTITSIVLYFSSFVLIYLQYKKRRFDKSKIALYFSVFGGISFFISCWSLFVLAMWWG